MIFYGLVDRRLAGTEFGEVIGFFATRELAEQAMSEVIADEPEFETVLEVVEVDLSGSSGTAPLAGKGGGPGSRPGRLQLEKSIRPGRSPMRSAFSTGVVRPGLHTFSVPLGFGVCSRRAVGGMPQLEAETCTSPSKPRPAVTVRARSAAITSLSG
jgi:hypothetical protein